MTVARRYGDFKGLLAVTPLFVQDNKRVAALNCGDRAGIGLFGSASGQQRIPAVDGCRGLEYVLVEVPGQGGPAGFAGGDLGVQAAGDPAGLGDHADACADLPGGVVGAAAG
ncbi:hypothetical protein ACIQM0_10395 [Streptomyces sp. NPDC091387]|uniref:hypothetical protein n=1 Tax=Streptomyces sp. NPDC091387 TaxID=3365998 RepID=UPI00380CC7AD